jgi:hypothetical protein
MLLAIATPSGCPIVPQRAGQSGALPLVAD